MYKKAVLYKGTYLAPGSQCLELYDAKKFKDLDKLLKELAQKEAELRTRYNKGKS